MISPVLLCGGSGTRLWPLSRDEHPKSFLTLFGDRSLFQATANRFADPRFGAPVVVTVESCLHAAEQQLEALGMKPAAILLEPEPRNTAPAALLAALHLRDRSTDALMLLQPCDHAIGDEDALRDAVENAAGAAREGRIVAFGVTPERPATGYGYLELGSTAMDGNTGFPQPLLRFVEKPDARTAEGMLSSGRHLWNAGIYLLAATTLVEAFETWAPGTLSLAMDGLRQARHERHRIRISGEAWSRITSASLDRAIMEKAANLSVMPLTGGWADIGSWDAVWRRSDADADGNVLSGRSRVLACRRSLLRSEPHGPELMGVGLDGIIAVATEDAVLVARMDDSQMVGNAAKPKAMALQEEAAAGLVQRPWGWFESLARGDGFHVKRMVVRPGAALSLQSHRHRDEHWVVVCGTAHAMSGAEMREIGANGTVNVPRGTRHRLENRGAEELIVVEVQTGSYFGEDDIIRYEDAYGRV